MRAATTMLILVLVAGYANARPVPPPAKPVEYSCEDGMTLKLRLTREHAEVTAPSGEQWVLPQHPSASPSSESVTVYGTEQNELRSKGDEATWTSGGHRPLGCRVKR